MGYLDRTPEDMPEPAKRSRKQGLMVAIPIELVAFMAGGRFGMGLKRKLQVA